MNILYSYMLHMVYQIILVDVGTDQEPGREGGTWFAMSKKGKIGILLNILLNKLPDPDKKGRGTSACRLT